MLEHSWSCLVLWCQHKGPAGAATPAPVPGEGAAATEHKVALDDLPWPTKEKPEDKLGLSLRAARKGQHWLINS